jgi:glutamate N-acetyltransferase/amino-acid N-acetyltransferase
MFKLFSLRNPINQIKGFYCNGTNCNLKDKENDLGFIYSENLCEIAALFTSNSFKAAPLKHFIQNGIKTTNFILVNSKIANALTNDGLENIEKIETYLKKNFPAIKNPVFSSTGVIGSSLPSEKIINGLKKIKLNSKNLGNFAKAIMTTDSFPKTIGFKIVLNSKESFTIIGIAKGAGMINPSLATMLCFILTDANIPYKDMEKLLKETADTTFNAISVDGDTSTNDSVFLLSNKKSGCYDKRAFEFALKKTMFELAMMIVKDGEGSKKTVAFRIKGAKNKLQAKKAAKDLSNSLLVKTALFGEDPNWGRIASTIGASGIECDERKLKIWYDEVLVYDGIKTLFTKEVEEKAYKILKKDEFSITCDIGVGKGEFVAYGCDLGYEYVKINSQYRT